MKMPPTAIHSYDLLSSAYDTLARWWSLDQIAQSRQKVIQKIRNSPQILILGPGTCEGFQAFESGICHLTLVDSSPEMLAAKESQWKSGLSGRLTVHLGDARSFQPQQSFDCIWLPYFLNVFSAEEVVSLLQKIKPWLKENGEIYISDFMPPDSRPIPRLIQEIWHGLPMAFFHAVTGNAWHSIHDLPTLIQQAGFQITESIPGEFGPTRHRWIGSIACKPA